MIFEPFPDEEVVINRIQKYLNSDFALLRLTPTMIDKNNLDANEVFRDLLEENGIVDYDALSSGGENGSTSTAAFIQDNRVTNVTLKFYKVANARGDRRFSIEKIKRKAADNEINIGDLLYISIMYTEKEPKIFIINLTHNTPCEPYLSILLGRDKINTLFEEIHDNIVEILNGGFYNNSKGPGPINPKDVGDTLEALLGITTNNSTAADYKGLIELKTKASKTLDTLFTLRPSFDGTIIEKLEPIDKSRVNAVARHYGYESENHPGMASLYITIGSKSHPLNDQGFYLNVNEEKKIVELLHTDNESSKPELVGYWKFENLKNQLNKKHPATLWFKAESRVVGDMVQFKYTEAEFSRSPRFTTFLSLIQAGILTYDWRGYTTWSGSYSGKNHGNAWRIKPKLKHKLFGSIEKVNS